MLPSQLSNHARKVTHMSPAGRQVILRHHLFGGRQLSLRGRFILPGTHLCHRGFSSGKLSFLAWCQRRKLGGPAATSVARASAGCLRESCRGADYECDSHYIPDRLEH
jgi:hypothetical protein